MSEQASSNEMAGKEAPHERELEELALELLYIPEFDVEDLRYWFVPSFESPKAVYQELANDPNRQWGAYYTSKGWDFLFSDSPPEGDGPFRVREGGTRVEVVDRGRFFSPKPVVRLGRLAEALPLAGLEKNQPLNPWRPNYLKSLIFIKKQYQWEHELPAKVVLSIYAIEECGEFSGSQAWVNAERILLQSDSEALRETLSDFFSQRPEEFELGSQIYLRVLGRLGDEGFSMLLDLAKHPVTRKRRHVATVLGDICEGRPGGIETLLLLANDEDFGVRDEALEALARVGVDATIDSGAKVASFLESEEIRHRVWAAAAYLKGGDESQRKFLVQLIKEDERTLSELGNLGEIVVRLNLLDVTPFLIRRFKAGTDDLALDAMETLSSLTGIELEYSLLNDAEAKRAAIKALKRWWDERKRERGALRKDGN
ncbi:MAG: HEAT repeat domain-containing protein [Planctomycetota bacterium]